MSEESRATSEHDDSLAPESAPPASAQDLVAQLVAAGEWPEPELLEQILAAGEAAVEPLREALKARPRGWPEEATLDHAVGLLSMLRPASAVPDLCAIARYYRNDSTEGVGLALAAYGPPGLDALSELIRDPSISGYQRETLIDCGFRAAGSDQALRARFAEAVREVFARVVEEARQAKAFEDELLAAPPVDNSSSEQDLEDEELQQLENAAVSDSTDHEDLISDGGHPDDEIPLDEEAIRHMEESSNELAPAEALEYLAMDLAFLADPKGRDLIRSAGEECLIHEGELFPRIVEETFEHGGEYLELTESWLHDYKAAFANHKESAARLARVPQVEFPTVASYPSFERPPREQAPKLQPVEPFRNTAPRIGRNDPCWCGSGKKYKKCHLGKDTPN